MQGTEVDAGLMFDPMQSILYRSISYRAVRPTIFHPVCLLHSWFERAPRSRSVYKYDNQFIEEDDC